MFLLFASLATLVAAAPRVLPNTHFTAADLQEYLNIIPKIDHFDHTKYQFHLRFRSAPWKVAVGESQYVLSMPMPGYKKEDIEVLAQKDGLIMRAINKEEDKTAKSQFVISALPKNVNPAGRWTYDGTMRVVFPIEHAENIENNAGGSDDSSSDVIPIVIDE
ncbi:uncharacterized protein LOC115445466 [Manduca sexta]|uniref:uncharacterized protein LOC115445466 n=1 Tax=Manduca sexta TaxID=7130 RepID=UPI00188DE02F|nr:uncharacterized protein LOC115445466 [Manduca sexta]